MIRYQDPSRIGLKGWQLAIHVFISELKSTNPPLSRKSKRVNFGANLARLGTDSNAKIDSKGYNVTGALIYGAAGTFIKRVKPTKPEASCRRIYRPNDPFLSNPCAWGRHRHRLGLDGFWICAFPCFRDSQA